MTKILFLSELREQLVGLPKEDIDDRLSFYEEMIDDRIAEGKSEEQAIDELGGVDGVVNEIAQETSLVKLVKHKVKPKRRLKAWEIVLIILGFPIWFPLLLTAFILCLVAYILVWIFVIVCYVTEAALMVTSIAGPIIFIANIASGNTNYIPLAAGIMAMGAGILLFFGCIGVTKVTLKLSKKIFTSIKKRIMKKGEQQ